MRRARQRRRLSMTSLIDVIFLLLLFFMLSSTFTRFAEVDLASAGAGTGAPSERPVFVSLAADSLRINGDDAALSALPDVLGAQRTGSDPLTVLIAARADVTAQRLTDVLAALRAVPDLAVTVLEAS